MSLEKRIEVLEQELTLLKNQIQATLLEIQEAVLAQKHAQLRGDVSQAGPQELDAYAPASEFTASYQQAERPHEATISNPRHLRQVSLKDEESSPKTPPFEETAPADNSATMDWQTLTELEDWVTAKIEKMGVKRTRQLVKMYTQEGRFTPEIARMLRQFISLHDNDAAPVEPQRKAPPRQRKLPASEPHEEEPAPSNLKQVHMPNDHRGDTRARPPVARPTAARQRPAPPAPAPAPVDVNTRDEEVEEEGHNMVLKLIAGVSNAGQRWKKPNG